MSEDIAAPPPPPSPEPAPRVRPTTVTVADLLLVLVAIVGAIGAVLTFTTIGTVSDVMAEAYQGTELEGTEGQQVIGSIVTGVIGLLFSIGFVVLAVLNNQGKNVARIVTWAIGGISLCCSGVGLGLTALVGSIQVDSQDAPDPAEVQERINDALPSWYQGVSLSLTIISILALIVALLLLALRPSNEFFRKPEQPFEPPTPNYPQVG